MMAVLGKMFNHVEALGHSKELMEVLLHDENQQQRQRTYDAISVKLNDMEICEKKVVSLMGVSGTL